MRRRLTSILTTVGLAFTLVPLVAGVTASPAAAATTGITATPKIAYNVAVAYPSAERTADAAHTFTAIVGTDNGVITGNVFFDITAGPNVTFPGLPSTACAQVGGTEAFTCTYPSAGVVGTDTIRVYADLNANGAFNNGEPTTTITKVWGGPAANIAMTPSDDSAPAGTCNTYTVQVNDQGGRPAAFAPVDVVIYPTGTTTHATNPGIQFCDPREANGPAGEGSQGPGDAFPVVDVPQGSGNFNQTFTPYFAGPGAVQGTDPCDDQTTAPDNVENCVLHGQFQTNNAGQLVFGVMTDPTAAGDLVDGAGTYDIRAFVETTNDGFSNDQGAGDPAATSAKTFTAGGANAVTTVVVTPETASNITLTGDPAEAGTLGAATPTHIFNVQLSGANGPIAGVTPRATIVGVNGVTAPATVPCSPSDQTGQSVCQYTPAANAIGQDNITVWVDQTSGVNTVNILDATEPRDTATKIWTNQAQNQASLGSRLLITCDGNVVESVLLFCTNPLNDGTEVLTSRVVSPAGQPLPGVRVQWVFDAEGNIGDSEDSTDGMPVTSIEVSGLSCITDANGNCSISIKNDRPRHLDAVIMHAYMWVDGGGGADYIQQAQSDPDTCNPCIAGDTFLKIWADDVDANGNRIPVAIELDPDLATNTVGDSHTVTGTVIDVLGNPVPLVPVDFGFDQTGAAPPGGPSRNAAFAGTTGLDRLSNASGQVSFTYDDDPAKIANISGPNEYDEINAWIDQNSDDANDGGFFLGGLFTATSLKKWVLGSDQPTELGIDVSSAAGVAGGPCNITIGPNGSGTGYVVVAGDISDHNVDSGLVGSNQICALVFNEDGTPLAGAPVTFSLTGVGSFQDPFTFEELSGPQVVLTDVNGYAFINVHSDESGTQTITATSNGQTDQGTIRYLSAAPQGRFITVEPATRTTRTGTVQAVTATVRDVFGNPVPNAPVQFRRTGVGVANSGTDPQIVFTGLDGTAVKTYTSGVEGVMTVTASIDPVETGQPNECTQLEGQGQNAVPTSPAGNCTDTSVINWDDDAVDGEDPGPGPGPGPGPVVPGPLPGYTLVAADGGIFNFGTDFFGSLGNLRLNAPIVGMAYTPTGRGYYLVASDGGIFAFGDAVFRGSTGNIRLVSPVVGMAVTPSGAGYWMVAADGGVFAFGDAVFRGSTGNIRLVRPIVAMMRTPSGGGYWLVASDGGVFAFGDAVFRGSTGNITLNLPIVGASRTPTGNGYYLVASDGGVFAFGDAVFRGSTGNIRLNSPVVGILLTPTGTGYWLIARDGGVFAFNAPFRGSTGNIVLNSPVVGAAAPPPGESASS